jgi:hypothetical protein
MMQKVLSEVVVHYNDPLSFHEFHAIPKYYQYTGLLHRSDFLILNSRLYVLTTDLIKS